MICYTLKCAAAHDFDSWFRSSEAFADLQTAGKIACPLCGSKDIQKSMMAPAVRSSRKAAVAPTTAPNPIPDLPPAGPLSQPGSAIEQSFAAMRREVEENSEYVGLNFATEARRMHEGDAPHRSIYGEARFDEARKLLEEGVPVVPLPFMPARKTN